MGLDKLRMLTPRRPCRSFFDEINVEFRTESDQRQRFQFTALHRHPEDPIDRISLFTEVRVISAKKGAIPGFNMVELNFLAPGGKQPPATVIECNPNNLPFGYKSLCGLVDWVFGDFPPDLKITRTDLNGELIDVSVQYCYDTVRVPNKRKSSEVGRLWKKRGAETFEVGKKPAQLTVYDKIEELKYGRKDVSGLPQVLTRFEWEYQGDHCPVRYFAELDGLLEVEPFSPLQFLSGVPYYDFNPNHPDSIDTMSLRLVTFNALKEKLALQDAWSVMNKHRNFFRDFREVVRDSTQFVSQLNESYLSSTRKFFRNECSDVFAVHGATPSLETHAEA